MSRATSSPSYLYLCTLLIGICCKYKVSIGAISLDDNSSAINPYRAVSPQRGSCKIWGEYATEMNCAKTASPSLLDDWSGGGIGKGRPATMPSDISLPELHVPQGRGQMEPSLGQAGNRLGEVGMQLLMKHTSILVAHWGLPVRSC